MSLVTGWLLDPSGGVRLTAGEILDLAGHRWLIEGPRRCRGRRPPGTAVLVLCPERAEASEGAQCRRCRLAEQILPCLRCRGDRCRNPIRRADCLAPANHAIYLASFGPGTIKIGIARWERRKQRLVEQGARAARIIGRADGLVARRLEHRAWQLGIPDRLGAQTRLQALTEPASARALDEQLLQASRWLLRRAPTVEWLAQPERIDLDPHPWLLAAPPQHTKPRDGLRLGSLVGHRGALLAFDGAGGRPTALSCAELVGWQLRPHQAAPEPTQLVMAL